MKNTIFLVLAALLFTASVQAQTTVDSIAAKYKLIPMPEPLTIEKTFPVLGTYQLAADASATTSMATATDASAVTTTTSSPNNVTITLDSVNKGVIWVSGMPQGTFKAYLKRSPATYRILAQKTDAGKEIPEGTLMLDPATNTLNIALGKDFDEVDPAAIFALNPALNPNATTEVAPTDNTVKVKVKTPTSKSKAKVTYYTATRFDAHAAAAPATDTQSTQQMNNQPTPQQSNTNQ